MSHSSTSEPIKCTCTGMWALFRAPIYIAFPPDAFLPSPPVCSSWRTKARQSAVHLSSTTGRFCVRGNPNIQHVSVRRQRSNCIERPLHGPHLPTFPQHLLQEASHIQWPQCSVYPSTAEFLNLGTTDILNYLNCLLVASFYIRC